MKKQILFLGPPPAYQDLSTRHDWPVKNAFVDLPIRLKGNLKRTSGNLLSLLGAQKRISVLLYRCYKMGLDYICNVG